MPKFRVTAKAFVSLEILVEAPDEDAAREAAGCEPCVMFNDDGAKLGAWTFESASDFNDKTDYEVKGA